MAGGSFIFREEWLEIMSPMTTDERNNVINAVISYAFTGEIGDLTPIEKVAFLSIKGSIDRDADRYEKTTEKNRNNGKKGGRPAATKQEAREDLSSETSCNDEENPLGYLGFSRKTQENPSKPTENVGFSEKTQEKVGFCEKTQQKTWVSDENPKNPILNPYPYPYPYPNPYSSFSFSFPENAEQKKEEQEQKILEFFFFQRKWAAPNEQLSRLIGYNSIDGRNWEHMSWNERKGAAQLWTQKNELPQKLTDSFLQVWGEIYAAAMNTGRDSKCLLTDSLSVSKKDDALILRLPCSAIDTLESLIGDDACDIRKIMSRYLARLKLKKLNYDECAT